MKKIVYLFGAGATQAEKMIDFSLKNPGKDMLEEEEVTNRGITKKVLMKMNSSGESGDKEILNRYGLIEREIEESVSEKFPNTDTPTGLRQVNIELLISAIESYQNDSSKKHAQQLRKNFREAITENIGSELQANLFKRLLDFHKKIEDKETVIGYLTLNYDCLFEKVLEKNNQPIDYGVDFSNVPIIEKAAPYFLKLHGSFNWALDEKRSLLKIGPSGEINEEQWIPPGALKNYSPYPYNVLIGKAHELLSKCDLLRIIGCSLNPTDFGIQSLLFRTQKTLSGNAFEIELIDQKTQYDDIKNKSVLSIKRHYRENTDDYPKENAFEDWLDCQDKLTQGD